MKRPASLPRSIEKPFDVLARGLVGAGERSGEGKVTPLELFAHGVLALEEDILALIQAA